MEMTFNPDPALQAEAMIDMFRTPPGDDFRIDEINKPTARACALIAARMCFASASYSRPINKRTKIAPQEFKSYWSAVIEHLEKK